MFEGILKRGEEMARPEFVAEQGPPPRESPSADDAVFVPVKLWGLGIAGVVIRNVYVKHLAAIGPTVIRSR